MYSYLYSSTFPCTRPQPWLVARQDIFFVQESWLRSESISHIDGYSFFRSDRICKPSSKRGSGGVVIYYKSSIQKFLTKYPSNSSDSLWVKLNKEGFGLRNDYFLCCTYIVPRNSVFFHSSNNMNKLQILQDEISLFKAKGEIIILGDLNARIGNYQENHTEFVVFQEPISAIESNVSDRLLPRSNKSTQFSQE